MYLITVLKVRTFFIEFLGDTGQTTNSFLWCQLSYFALRFLFQIFYDVKPSPTSANNNKVPLNALTFYNCDNPTIPFECSGYTKEHDDSKWNIFKKKKGLHILHLNVNSLLPKID